MAEFERDLIGERTHAVLAAATVRGHQGGRKPVITDSFDFWLGRRLVVMG